MKFVINSILFCKILVNINMIGGECKRDCTIRPGCSGNDRYYDPKTGKCVYDFKTILTQNFNTRSILDKNPALIKQKKDYITILSNEQNPAFSHFITQAKASGQFDNDFFYSVPIEPIQPTPFPTENNSNANSPFTSPLSSSEDGSPVPQGPIRSLTNAMGITNAPTPLRRKKNGMSISLNNVNRRSSDAGVPDIIRGGARSRATGRYIKKRGKSAKRSKSGRKSKRRGGLKKSRKYGI